MAHGTLVYNPPFRIASADAATLQAQLGATAQGAQLLLAHRQPDLRGRLLLREVLDRRRSRRADRVLRCVDGAHRRGADLFGPAADRRICARNRNRTRRSNIADITNPSNTEGVLIAAMFAAQGYIVVAPNYAGYDISTLGLSPVLQRGSAVGRNDGYPRRSPHRAPQHDVLGNERQRAAVPQWILRGRFRRHGDLAGDASGRTKSHRLRRRGPVRMRWRLRAI